MQSIVMNVTIEKDKMQAFNVADNNPHHNFLWHCPINGHVGLDNQSIVICLQT